MAEPLILCASAFGLFSSSRKVLTSLSTSLLKSSVDRNGFQRESSSAPLTVVGLNPKVVIAIAAALTPNPSIAASLFMTLSQFFEVRGDILKLTKRFARGGRVFSSLHRGHN